MKTIIISILLLIATTGFASANPDAGLNRPDNLRKHLTSKVKFPKDLKIAKKQSYVLVDFTVKSNGFIEVGSINGHPELINPVLESLAQIRLCPFDKSSGNQFQMKFNFLRL